VTAIRSVVLGCGSYLPQQILTNAELAARVDTSDEWIVQRTGIRQRHIAAEGEFTSHLAINAARAALTDAGIDAQAVDLIILATSTPDNTFPATAVAVQNALGINHGAAFDLQAVCSGFVFALATADNFLRTGAFKRALVIGAETFSRILDWNDRGTCVLFGDGAGAAILQHRENSHGLLTAVMGADGNKADLLSMPGGGSACPATLESVAAGLHYLRMDGKETFKNAVQAMVSAAHEAMRRCDIDITKIKCVIPHQANQRIVDAVGDRLKATPEQVFVNLQKYGNTSAASVAIALDEVVASGKIQRGDLVLLVVFGAGLTWGAAVIEW
jgi:3-oxoacyl-[acyl-carrier-protein] synthase III